VIERLRQALATADWEMPVPVGDIALAAVLIPVFYKEGEYHILFTKRTERVKSHKGEISFPGGAYEPEDITLCQTALRETQEEIGIAPADVNVIGQIHNATVSVTKYLISAFVGTIPYPHMLKLEEAEVAEAFEVPVSFLLNPANLHEAVWEREGRKFDVQFYNYKDYIIWGATGRILKVFLPLWAKAASEERL
jgi:8-oxo-dGTP pyrophosphatase MutT (NUDIX family)